MKFLLSESNPQKWMHCNPYELEDAKARIIDQDLSQLLAYGIGMHHAGTCAILPKNTILVFFLVF